MSSKRVQGSRVKGFYTPYHGHHYDHLEIVHTHLQGSAESPRPCVFLAGDSSLDNKYWFRETAPALNGYEDILSPSSMKQDVAYWLNKEAVESGAGWFALNCAVEESALADRRQGRFLPQDEFIRDHITERDTLIVSVGGNDIALKPTAATAASMLTLTHATTVNWIQSAGACSCDGWTCGTCALRPPGLAHFIGMFGNEVESYIARLISKTKPKRVVICMIYFPLEVSSEACWADRALSALKYNSFPQKLQTVIQTLFELGTKRIKLEDTQVIPFPLFKVLDGKIGEDYVARVEPSAKGGSKMGKALVDVINKESQEDGLVVDEAVSSVQ